MWLHPKVLLMPSRDLVCPLPIVLCQRDTVPRTWCLEINMGIYSSVGPLTSSQFQDSPPRSIHIRRIYNHVTMYISGVFVLALAGAVATALVLERQAYNRTMNCLVTSGFWGGYCPSVDPVTELGVSCQ